MYEAWFVAVLILCVLLELYSRRKGNKSGDTKIKNVRTPEFEAFQRNWLTVYLLAMLSDWMQGPYVYALYMSYGYSEHQIAQLFVTGFGSSMVVGTCVGALSDKYGRRIMCLCFAIFYMLSALAKLVPSFGVLMLGRFLSGVATSLLYSTFEAWMVCEHNRRGFDPSLLRETFTKATLWNSIIAVLSGLVAKLLSDTYGFIAPFMFVLLPLAILVAMVWKWPENYGNESTGIYNTFMSGIKHMQSDFRIVLLGLAQSAYEGAMFAFVFLWSPALISATPQSNGLKPDLPFGVIFAAFMVSVMIGSRVFAMLSAGVDVSHIPFVIHSVAFLSMTAVAAFLGNAAVMFVGFLVFEVTCGMFWPTFGTLRSKLIPEDCRAAVSNFFRVPLNAFVVLLLLNSKSLSSRTKFVICAAAHLFSFLTYALLATCQVIVAISNRPLIDAKSKKDKSSKAA